MTVRKRTRSPAMAPAGTTRGIDAAPAAAVAAPAAAPTAAPSTPRITAPGLPDDPALRTADQVRAVAALLSGAADAYNRRLKAEAPALSSGEAFARLQEEQRLRGIANQLYFEASQKTLDAAVGAQAELEATLHEAQQRLERFEHFARALDLVADLLVLGGALVAGKASTIVASLKEVRSDLAGA